MISIYNLFEEVIFEELEKSRLLTEGVSDNEVDDAIKGKYNVNILYDDDEGRNAPSKRYIQVYNKSVTKGGNDCIRAFQIFGGSKTTPKEGAWKIFRLDRIRGWFPTNKKWQNPVSNLDASIPKYNQNGDRSMSLVKNKVDPSTFNNNRNDINKI